MKLNLKFQGGDLYRGEVPFYLEKLDRSVVYLCSSKKNIDDYYWVLRDIFQGEIIKPEGNGEEDYLNFNYKILDALEKERKFIVLVSLEFFLKEYMYSGNRIILNRGERFDLKELIGKLEENGYERSYLLEKREQYSLRGDILDFFPVNGEHPIRVEFFDDEIERITYFHLDTQRSIEKLESVDLYMDNNKHRIKNFIEHFRKKFSVSPEIDFGDSSERDVMDELELEKLEDRENFTEKMERQMEKERERLREFHGIEFLVENREVLQYRFQEILFENRDRASELQDRFDHSIGIFTEIKNRRFQNEEQIRYQDYDEVKKLSHKSKIVILSEEERRYRDIFKDYPNISLIKYPFYEGFRNGETLYLTDRELKGIKVKREIKRTIEVKRADIDAIHEGDYIIHESFGVGIYLGMKIINETEYLEIKYAGEDKLFVPMNNLDRIDKFQVEPGMEPEIYKLGRKGFKRRRERLQEEMIEFAREIIAVQAKRSLNEGHRFESDTILQEEFEDSFPYNLTPDQGRAVEDVKSDMESGKVMDRIVVGDVGCGKTEVAIRAAFKAAMEGKQVAFMVPTTVLAQQHFERIAERLKNYPINIELLSRLKSERELQECYKKIASGGIDIIVGTHKILSKEITFRDLGLVIIDEEQKFGVRAKEQLKTLRNNVDMLTLTATPIPRTLNLALLGIRDISIIETLPEGRLPIQDFFIEGTDENIRDAIMREFAREGQVFYIYNWVKRMDRREEELRKILPSFIRLTHIHGQMAPREIRDILHQFENGEIDVLLATTIVENGIDVENANTIIIEGIEKLGLSQMYQLRGRVGRGSERGYCYFVTDIAKESRSKAKIREESMRGLSEMGAGTGFNLSMEDMRIRGAGEVLGDRQHGALEVLGYGLYMKLLQDEIAKLRGEYVEALDSFHIELKIPRYIPEGYVAEDEKLLIYKRVANFTKLEDISEMREELEDRFGKLPLEAISYLRGEKLKIMARHSRVTSIIEERDETIFRFEEGRVDVERIMEMMSSGRGKYERKDQSFRYFGTAESFFQNYIG